MRNIPNNLIDYIKVYDNFLDTNLCDNTVDSLKFANWETHKFYNPISNVTHSYENDLEVSADNIFEKNIIQDRLWFAVEKYISQDFDSFKDWWSGWNGYSSIRFNRYVENMSMKNHCDHIQGIFDGSRKGIPILSIVGLLNDDYEGGNFYMWNDHKINLKKGSILIFPSNFMFPHRVDEIKKGSRYSFVSWVW
jgi:hypothetical protein